MGKKTEEREKRFVLAYLKDLNATKAAIAAGYSESTARAAGARLLTKDNILKAIEAGANRICEKHEVKAEDVIRELKNIAFLDLREAVEWGANGVNLKEAQDLKEEVARAISEVGETRNQHGTACKIKTHDKMKALEMLGRHLGMWKDVEVNVTLKPVVIQRKDGTTLELGMAKPEKAEEGDQE